jgi:hypothetical protein
MYCCRSAEGWEYAALGGLIVLALINHTFWHPSQKQQIRLSDRTFPRTFCDNP